MASDPKRVQQVMQHIRLITAGDYPQVQSDDPNGPFRIVERPWKEIPEPSKLAILQDAVDWTSISNRDRAHILLGQIDPGQISDAQRRQLIDMAAVKEPPQEDQAAAIRGTLRARLNPPAARSPEPPHEPSRRR
jgi:hypothetical protein